MGKSNISEMRKYLLTVCETYEDGCGVSGNVCPYYDHGNCKIFTASDEDVAKMYAQAHENGEKVQTLDEVVKIDSGRRECLENAIDTVCSNREAQYGSPEDNFNLIAGLWSAYIGVTISANDVCMLMCMLKIARIKTGAFKADSYIDLAGYAACGAEIGGKNEH